MGQGFNLVPAFPVPLVLVTIVDGAIEWKAAEMGPVDEPPACDVHKVLLRHEVIPGVPLQGDLRGICLQSDLILLS